MQRPNEHLRQFDLPYCIRPKDRAFSNDTDDSVRLETVDALDLGSDSYHTAFTLATRAFSNDTDDSVRLETVDALDLGSEYFHTAFTLTMEHFPMTLMAVVTWLLLN